MNRVKLSSIKQSLRIPYKRLISVSILVVIICTTQSCHRYDDEVNAEYKNYPFDSKVIEKLPLYDSLASALIENYSILKKYFDEEESYRGFRYRPASTDIQDYVKLPPEAGPKIGRYYDALGKDFIYGFDLFKDSSIKVCIRTRNSDTTDYQIEENISYYPEGKGLRKREFPAKDSILNKYWQYWMRFNKRGVF